MEHATNKLRQFLAGVKITDMKALQNQQIVQFEGSELVANVFNKLNDMGIYSAPVFDSTAKKFVGMVDLKDFLTFVLSLHLKGEPITFTADSVVDFSGTNPFVPQSSDTDLMEVLVDFSVRGLHRCPVIDNHGKMIGILSQSTLVKFLAEHINVLKEASGSRTLKDFNFAGFCNGTESQVIQVRLDQSLLHAFSLLDKFNVNGIPVVDKDGILQGMVGVKDIHFLFRADLDHVTMKIEDFFKHLTGKRPPLVTCKGSTLFWEAVEMMAKTGVHRLAVTNDKNEVVDIITMTNVIELVVYLAYGMRRR